MDSAENTLITRTRELFMAYGVKSITMDDIALRLGISKKTIYQYFKDKNDLVHKVFTSFMCDHQLAVEKFLDCLDNENAVSVFHKIIQFGIRDLKKINPTVFLDLQKFHHETWREFEKFKVQTMLLQIETLLKKGRDQGLFRTDCNLTIMSHMHMMMLEKISDPSFVERTNTEVWELMREMTMIFLRGICTEKGLIELEKQKQTTQI
jgi:AcrR family transcriptional regulator